MKEKTIITSGCTFVDIDAVACAVALFEIEKFLNNETYLSLSESLSASVTKKYLHLLNNYEKYKIGNNDKLIIVDSSGLSYFRKECNYNIDNIVKIFDHHLEDIIFWQKKLGPKSRIEKIGAAATLIYEYAEEKKALKALNNEVLEILAAAIVHNTQDFQTEFSCARDERVFKEISKKIFKNKEEAEKWKENYFLEIDKDIFHNSQMSLISEIKKDPVINGKTFIIIQLEMFEGNRFIKENKEEIWKILYNENRDYKFFMSASIRDSGTYFYTRNEESQKLLENILKIEFKNNKAFYNKIILRKEVLDKIVKIK